MRLNPKMLVPGTRLGRRPGRELLGSGHILELESALDILFEKEIAGQVFLQNLSHLLLASKVIRQVGYFRVRRAKGCRHRTLA
jgi:hypothetical protein